MWDFISLNSTFHIWIPQRFILKMKYTQQVRLSAGTVFYLTGDFRCKDRRSCVSKSLVCDEITSTENPRSSPTKPSCISPSFRCPDSTSCINPAQICDGKDDCPDGSDENCVEKSDFLCTDRRSCISRNLVCDGRSHCHDGSDEVNCLGVTSPASRANVLKCRMGSRPCSDGTECVLYSHICDGENDCTDGSDEKGCLRLPGPIR
uniref:Si:dkey-88l16.3 n=1 Tax=Acanthochromis polyacanthus TaxID=80966 RepID=A0A3Q1HWS3_9TELE